MKQAPEAPSPLPEGRRQCSMDGYSTCPEDLNIFKTYLYS